MKIDALRIRLIVCLILDSLVSACGSSSSKSTALDPTTFGKQYAFANNSVSGWQQATDSTNGTPFEVCTPATLEQRIDGGSEDYVSRGLVLAMYQVLIGPDPQSCTVVAMDFGTADNATAMFTYEQQHTSASIQIPQFDASVAIAYPVLSGITVYAHVNAMYFELQLMGYGSDQATPAQVATQLLNTLKSKTH